MTQPAAAGPLDTPQRQLPIAILAEFFGGAALRQFGETLLPALVLSIVTSGRLALIALPAAAVVAFGLVVLRWWRTMFWVEHEELILEKGVLNRTRLQVPLDRIQQISTEQGIIQQLFDVRKVAVDTAGSVGAEFSLTAVSNDVVAELRRLIVGADRIEPLPPMPRDLVPGAEALPTGPATLNSSGSTEAPEWSTRAGTGHAEAVLRMRLGDLVQVGVVRPGGQVLSAVIALLGLGLGSAINSFIESRITGAVVGAIFIVGAVVFTILALVGGAVLRDFDLTVWRSQQGLRLTAGLLTKREHFARTERVQLVRRRANAMERLLGRTTVVLPQASATAAASTSSSGQTTQNFVVPSVPNDTVDRLTSLFLVDHPAELDGTISPLARWRWSLYGSGWPTLVLLTGAAIVVGYDGPTGLAVAMLIIATATLGLGLLFATLSQRRWRWELDPHTLRTHNGVLIDQRSDVELHKIQSVELRRGWWQRRNGLASVECSTAGGGIAIPHLDVATAELLRDRVLVAIEQSEGPWM